MLPGGKLYVPGAERLLPNIRRLTDAARQGRVFLVSHGCYHTKDDPEFKTFPPHCIKGTPGSAYVPEALTDIFASRHAGELVKRLGDDAEFVVFGVVTEYCVGFAAKGLLERRRRVSVVKDAIETLKTEDGQRTVAELQALGARLITTDQALALLNPAK